MPGAKQLYVSVAVADDAKPTDIGAAVNQRKEFCIWMTTYAMRVEAAVAVSIEAVKTASFGAW